MSTQAFSSLSTETENPLTTKDTKDTKEYQEGGQLDPQRVLDEPWRVKMLPAAEAEERKKSLPWRMGDVARLRKNVLPQRAQRTRRKSKTLPRIGADGRGLKTHHGGRETRRNGVSGGSKGHAGVTNGKSFRFGVGMGEGGRQIARIAEIAKDRRKWNHKGHRGTRRGLEKNRQIGIDD